MAGRDLVRDVTPKEPIVLGGDDGDGRGPRIAMIDTGVKRSIVRNLTRARRDRRAAPVHRDRRNNC